jgi:hypothetical protein
MTTAIIKGRVLFTNMGRVLLSATETDSGAHDVPTGGPTAASDAAKYAGDHNNTRDKVVVAAS